MNNAKTISKAKITLGAILLTFVMLLTLIATPLIAHAATTQKNHASYNTKTGEVTLLQKSLRLMKKAVAIADITPLNKEEML